MSALAGSPGTFSIPQALLFTDARGRVVFVDAHFLELLGGSAGVHVGEPLHRVLGSAQAEISRLLNEVSSAGYAHDVPLTVEQGGQPRVLYCTGVATYDPNGAFIGADITLREAGSGEPEAAPVTHSDVLQQRIQQITSEAEGRKTVEDKTRLALYFTTQIGAIRVLLARMGGPRVADTLEAALNKRARDNHWPMTISLGEVILDDNRLDGAAYRALLEEALDYAANVIGRRVAQAEMQTVDGHINGETRDVAEQAGLRVLL